MLAINSQHIGEDFDSMSVVYGCINMLRQWVGQHYEVVHVDYIFDENINLCKFWNSYTVEILWHYNLIYRSYALQA